MSSRPRSGGVRARIVPRADYSAHAVMRAEKATGRSGDFGGRHLVYTAAEAISLPVEPYATVPELLGRGKSLLIHLSHVRFEMNICESGS